MFILNVYSTSVSVSGPDFVLTIKAQKVEQLSSSNAAIFKKKSLHTPYS